MEIKIKKTQIIHKVKSAGLYGITIEINKIITWLPWEEVDLVTENDPMAIDFAAK